MAMLSFLTPSNGQMTPGEVERRRKLAEALMQTGTDSSPISSPWQAAARLASAVSGTIQRKRADSAEAAGRKSAASVLAQAMSGSPIDYQSAAENPWIDPQALMSLQNTQGDIAWEKNTRDHELSLRPAKDAFDVAKMQNELGGFEATNSQRIAWTNYVKSLSPEDQLKANAMGADKYFGKGGADGGGVEYGLNPIVTQNPDTGEYQLLQPSKDGSAPRVMQLPEGAKYVPPTRTLDLGPNFVTVPTKGAPNPIGAPIEKDLAGAEREKKIGAGQGEAVVNYKSMKSKLPGLQTTVNQLGQLADKATYTALGKTWNEVVKQGGWGATEGGIARASYISMVQNQIFPILRDTFGAQFTKAEGDALLSTLGDPDLPPESKKAVLQNFIEQKVRDLDAQAAQAGIQPDATETQPAPTKRLKYNPDTGELE